MAGLFREEVIAAQRESWLGPVRLGAPLALWPMAWLGIALVVSIAALIGWGRHTLVQRASGELAPTMGIAVIKTSGAGVVNRLFVVEGDHVTKGDALIEISTDRSSSDFGTTAAATASLLKMRLLQLDQEQAGIEALCASQTQALQVRAANADTQQAKVASEQKILQKQVDINADMVKRIQPLISKGYVSHLQFAEQAEQLMHAESDIAELGLKQAQLQQQSADTKVELTQQPIKCRSLRADNESKVQETKRQLYEGALQRSITLHAPITGTVTNSTAVVGKVLQENEHLVDIEPKNASLQAQLWMPSGGIGFIKAGQRVQLHYDAYPEARYGKLWGTVRSVSGTPLSPADFAGLTGRQGATNMYRVTVALESQWILAGTSNVELKPGEALTGDITIGEEPLFARLFGRPSRQAGSIASLSDVHRKNSAP